MVSTKINGKDDEQQETLVYGHKLSSVGPARVTGELTYEPSNMDLAMKLHYLRVVYLLESQATKDLTMRKIKESLFAWLNYYYETCGRFRRSPETGRPYIKCNDCGTRLVEAKSSKTLEEWVGIMEEDTSSQRLLVYEHVLGPELTFSPPVFLQMTSLKCGGLSIGVSWAHVLGDPISLSGYMNLFARFLNGLKPTYSPTIKKSPPNNLKPKRPLNKGPLSLKRTGPVGDDWIVPTPYEMDTFSFHVTTQQLAKQQMKVSESGPISSPTRPFELICTTIWQAVAKARIGSEPDTITVIRQGSARPKADDTTLRNNQAISSVRAGFSVSGADLKGLAELIRDQAQDEIVHIGEIVGRDPAGSDFVIYGANLTFVDMSEVDFYGFELKGLRPKLVNCFVDGIGEEGVVLVLPSPNSGYKIGDGGRLVTLILPKSYMKQLKEELKNEWPPLG